MNIFDLTAHQLDVLRTFGQIVGGIGGFIGGVGGVAAILARYWAKQAAKNTSSRVWVGGHLTEVPVSEHARHAMLSGEAARQETADLSDWMRGNGRRRLPTTELPRQEPSTYE